MSLVKGVILIGGPSVGTRFRPLSMDLPKPLFPIAGSPMIYHHIAALSKVPGMKEILLVGFYEQSVLDRFLTEVQMEFYNINIRYLREYQALGTAGGLYHFRDELMRGNPQKILVLNGDICSSFPLENMCLFLNNQKDSVACLLTIAVDKEEVHKYGCVVIDQSSNEVLHFVEKPKSFISDLISCGVYVFDPKIFDVMKVAIENRRAELIEQNIGSDGVMSNSFLPEKIHIEKDVLTLLVSSKKLFAYVCEPKRDFWMQIKTPTAAIPANKLYLQHFRRTAPRKLSTSSPRYTDEEVAALEIDTLKSAELIQPVIIHPTAIVHPTAKIGPNVMIGPRVLIGRGVRITNAIVLDSSEIKNDACVTHAILGWESKVGAWTRVEGAPGDANHLNATYKGLKIPTATVLGRDVVIDDELVVRNCIVLPHKELNMSYHNEILM